MNTTETYTMDDFVREHLRDYCLTKIGSQGSYEVMAKYLESLHPEDAAAWLDRGWSKLADHLGAWALEDI